MNDWRHCEPGSADSCKPCLSVSCQCEPRLSPRLSHRPSTGGREGKGIVGRADRDGWAVEESTYGVSQPCAEVLNLVQMDLW